MVSIILTQHSGVIIRFPASKASIEQQQLKVKAAAFYPRVSYEFSSFYWSTSSFTARGVTMWSRYSSALHLLNLAENVHFTPVFRPRNEHSETSPKGIKRSQYPWRLSASERTDDDVSKTTPSSDKKASSAKQEEIISLFRRIQSSISKVDSVSNEKKGTNPNQNKPMAQLDMEITRQSRKQAKDKVSLKGGNKQKPRRRSFPKKEEDVEPILSPVTDIKSTRPPSNFVKKSPIPFPSAPRGKEDQWNETSPAITRSNDSTSQKLEEMKLQELKELAKSRGVRGYSRLKKKELVELLIP